MANKGVQSTDTAIRNGSDGWHTHSGSEYTGRDKTTGHYTGQRGDSDWARNVNSNPRSSSYAERDNASVTSTDNRSSANDSITDTDKQAARDSLFQMAKRDDNGSITITSNADDTDERKRVRQLESSESREAYDAKQAEGFNKAHGVDTDKLTEGTKDEQSFEMSKAQQAGKNMFTQPEERLQSSEDAKAIGAAPVDYGNKQTLVRGQQTNADAIANAEAHNNTEDERLSQRRQEQADWDQAKAALTNETRQSTIGEESSTESLKTDLDTGSAYARELANGNLHNNPSIEAGLNELADKWEQTQEYALTGEAPAGASPELRAKISEYALINPSTGLLSDMGKRAYGVDYAGHEQEIAKIASDYATGKISEEEATEQLSHIEVRVGQPDVQAGLREFLATGASSPALDNISDTDLETIMTKQASLIHSGLDQYTAAERTVEWLQNNPDVAPTAEVNTWNTNRNLASWGITTMAMFAPSILGQGFEALSSSVGRTSALNKIKQFLNAHHALRNAVLGGNTTATVNRLAGIAHNIGVGTTAVITAGGAVAAAGNRPELGISGMTNEESTVDIGPRPEDYTPSYREVPQPEYTPDTLIEESSFESDENIRRDLDTFESSLSESGLSQQAISNMMGAMSGLSLSTLGSDEFNEALNNIDKALSSAAGELNDPAKTAEIYSKAVDEIEYAKSRVDEYVDNKLRVGAGKTVDEQVDNILSNPNAYDLSTVAAAQRIKDSNSDLNDDTVYAQKTKIEQVEKTVMTAYIREASFSSTEDLGKAFDKAVSFGYADDSQSAFESAENMNPDIKSMFGTPRIVSSIKAISIKAKDWMKSTAAGRIAASAKEWIDGAKSTIKSALSKAADAIDKTMLGNLKSAFVSLGEVASNLFSPVKAASAGLRSAQELTSFIADLITSPFSGVNKKVDDFNAKLDNWYSKGKAAVTGKANDLETQQVALQTRRARQSAYAIAEICVGILETALSLGSVGTGTMTNGFIKLYGANRNLDNKALGQIQDIMRDMYNLDSPRGVTERSEHGSIDKHNVSSNAIGATTATSANEDNEGDLSSKLLERDVSGWNEGIADDLYASNPELYGGFVNNLQ